MRIRTAPPQISSFAAHVARWVVLALLIGAGCGNKVTATDDAATSATDGIGADTQVPDGGSDGSTGDTLAGEGIDSSSDLGDGTSDGGDASAFDINSTCPGGAFCPCKVNTDCDNNLCLEVPDGHRCGIDCGGGSCPDNFLCKLINTSGGDTQYICVAKWGRLCEPCDSSQLCAAALGNDKGVCIAYGGVEGNFCGTACDTDADCPTAYGCKDVTSVEGKAAKQCARLPDGGGHIQCPCDANAAAEKLATTCNAAVATGGSCPGVRACGSSGLSTCSVSPNAIELCDGIDNDCNGLTDDVVCDDKNPCTDDACLAASQTCAHPANTQICSDGSACTSEDVCTGGVCTGKALDCDDQNPCTTDSCDKKLGCQHDKTSAPCSDGNACTLGDTCIDGDCVIGKKKDCDDKNACTLDLCDDVSGTCSHGKLSDNACSDGDFCTENDVCVDGACSGTPANCNDANPCTSDACVTGTGCVLTPVTSACDDGNPCTIGDKCVNSACTPVAGKDCSDQNQCTTDSCDPVTGACQHKLLAANACDDSNVCTDDSCDPNKGCVHTPTSKPCDDNDACTSGDTCISIFGISGCKGNPIVVANVCNDFNECTMDACDSTIGCQYAPKVGTCEDGNPCTQDDTCDTFGQCVAGKNICGCANDNDCTQPTDLCAGVSYCDKSAAPYYCKIDPKTKVVCDTSKDDACKATTCDSGTGKCAAKALPDSKPCDADGSVCTLGDACKGGICAPGLAQNCDDSNPCTIDSCDPKLGCVNSNSAAPCTDGDACTQNDVCNSGKCQSGAAKNCSDNNTCTIDACDSASGACSNTASFEGTSCEDGDKCTHNELCTSGQCIGTAISCDDGNSCTTDSCVPANGCSNATVPGGTSCSDGDACTIGDACSGQVCGGTAKPCDDSNPCTIDSCDGIGGCTYSAINGSTTTGCDATVSAACATGNCWCTAGACKAKGCGDGALDSAGGEQCDDGNAGGCDGCEACQKRGALLFGGDGGYGTSTGTSSTAPGLGVEGDMTIEAWVNIADFKDDRPIASFAAPILTGGASAGAQTYALAVDKTGKLAFQATLKGLGFSSPEIVTASGVSVAANQWTHVAAVVAGQTVRLFVNGKPSGTGTLVNPRINIATATFSLGRSYPDAAGAGFKGQIDEVHLATAPLYAAAFVPNRRVTPTANTRALWHFDEGTGSTASDASGNVQKYPLTLSGHTWTSDTCYGVAANAGVCGDGNVASALEECDDGNTDSCDACQDCRVRRAMVFSDVKQSEIIAPNIGTWAGDAFCTDCKVTMEAWFRLDKFPNKPDAANANTWGTLFNVTNQMTATLYIDETGTLNFIRSGMFQPKTSLAPVGVGEWHHVALQLGWWHHGQVRLYLDGVLQFDMAPNDTSWLPGNTSFDTQLLGAEALTIGALDPTSQLSTDKPAPDDYFPGAMDEVRVSAGLRYGANFAPQRRAAPDAQTRALWHLDQSTGTLVDDSGNATPAVTSVVGFGSEADACLGKSTSARCGDNQLAPWEMCESVSGVASKSIAFPAKASPNLDTCGTTWTNACAGGIQWASGDEIATQIGANPMTYPKAGLFVLPWTLEGWVRLPAYPTASPTGAILSTDSSQNFAAANCTQPVSQSWAIQVTADGTDATVIGGTAPSTPAKRVWKVGVWQHFALQYHGDLTGSFWVDGQKVRAFPVVTTNWSGSPCQIRLGQRDGGNRLAASLASLQVTQGIKYGQPFDPQWQLAKDAKTAGLWEFTEQSSTLASATGLVAGKFDLGNASHWLKTGPYCPNQPTP